MPVDHPAPISAPTRRTYLRTLSLALGFLLTLGALMALRGVMTFGSLS